MQNNTVKEGKTMAIISYLWWIGFIIAFFLNNKNKNSFTSFHIRQSIGLLLLSLVANIAYSYLRHTPGYLLNLGVFVLWVMGLISAFNGEEKGIPILGDKFQDWFKGIS